MSDERRKGDARPLDHDATIPLTWWPAASRPVRWLPKHGQPYCVAEWLSQAFIRFVAHVPVYTGIVVTVILVIQLFHPLGLGR